MSFEPENNNIPGGMPPLGGVPGAAPAGGPGGPGAGGPGGLNPDGSPPDSIYGGNAKKYISGKAFPRPQQAQGSTWRDAPAAITEFEDTYKCDVVVVGGGHAGSCAVKAAVEAGATVILIERQPQELMTYLGGGQVGHINSEFLRSRGFEDIPIDVFVSDWQLRTNNRSNAGLVAKFAQNSGRCFDWLIAPLSQEEKDSITTAPVEGRMVELNGIKTWAGPCGIGRFQKDLLKGCQQAALTNGGKLLYGHSAEQLIKNDDGAVIGVVAMDLEGKYYRVLASKGVILSAGDFSGNLEMCEELVTEMVDNGFSPKGYHCDGTGIQMGVWAGGKLEPRPISTMGGNYTYPTDSMADPLGTAGALWLNKYGKRYSNEAFSGDIVLSAVPGMRQPRGKLTCVFDSDMINHGNAFAQGHKATNFSQGHARANLERLMQSAVEAGDQGVPSAGTTLYAADTLEELARRVGYEGQAALQFVASVERYNQLCRDGHDIDFGKDPKVLFPVAQAPFFAYAKEEIKPGPFMVTTGGLLTDDDQNVIDANCEPIPGLYASGNCCGGRFGLQYHTPVSGISLGMAQTLGMLAGETVAKLDSRNID